MTHIRFTPKAITDRIFTGQKQTGILFSVSRLQTMFVSHAVTTTKRMPLSAALDSLCTEGMQLADALLLRDIVYDTLKQAGQPLQDWSYDAYLGMKNTQLSQADIQHLRDTFETRITQMAQENTALFNKSASVQKQPAYYGRRNFGLTKKQG